ncbi:MAG: DNA-binding transcriptional MerR regulator [Myxococcota bacterium]|jgi:DNA-binding transcriptional MerR regulator
MGYRIKTVAEILGIPRNTLLAWERRYNIVQPSRQDNGYREYSDIDIATLRELKQLIDDGHRVSEAISLMQAARTAHIHPDEQATADLVEQLLDALLRFDGFAATSLLRRSARASFAAQIDDIYMPLQRHVGELWTEDALSVAQEHIVSHFVRDQLIGMLAALDYGPPTGRLTLCVAPLDEQHDIALLGLSVKLAMRNHRIIYIGPQTPLPGLVALIGAHRPSLVCLSLTIPRSRDQIIELATVLSEASAETGSQIAIGGAGLPCELLPTIPRVQWARRSRDLIA